MANATYNFNIAKEVLNENDKNRLMCLFLNCQPNAINWEKATADFGCASVESMRVMTRSALKKIEKAGGKEEGDTSTVKTTPKKRKAAAKDGDEVEEDAPKPKKGRGKAKKSAASPVEEDSADAEQGVKIEATGDE